MKTKYPFYFLFLFILFSCKQNNKYENKSVTIIIQPFNDLSATQIKNTFNQLKLINPNIVLRAAIDLPPSAYYKKRNRYRADSLIRFLRTLAENNQVVIGMTSKDISTTKDKIEDWGVMGLGFCPGNACMVSTYRLTKTNKDEQFYKVSIHELGHTQGLPHCINKTCFMRDAEGGNPLDEETDFCNACKLVLKQKGWALR
jgi:archaemetzincin